MSLDTADTIAAIASASGGAYRGILRISGPGTIDCLEQCFRVDSGASLHTTKSPTIHAGLLQLNADRFLPTQLYLWPTQRSYTRQITAELHTIGSPPLLDAALAALCHHGARVAEPGEFTLRAFLAGRLDLTQAEAVLGVIDARSRTELDTALGQLAGGLATPLTGLRNELLNLLAHLEAGLDFVDEDIEFITAAELDSQLTAAAERVQQIAEKMSSRGESANEPRVVFRGAPNVGKSSLLNALAGEQAAIVSEIPGTTRDYVIRRVMFAGQSCLLIDTAGVEEADDAGTIAAAAQSMTSEQSFAADVQLICIDGTRPLNSWELEQLANPPAISRIIVRTKCDSNAAAVLPLDPSAISTSSHTGAGLPELCQAIARDLASAQTTGVVAGTAARCSASLLQAAESLHRARQAASMKLGEEFVAAEVRAALDDLGRVVGAIYTDDLLDRIFSRFCIGK